MKLYGENMEKERKPTPKIHPTHIRSEMKNTPGLERSIREIGMVRPILVDEHGYIIDGARRFTTQKGKVKQGDIRVIEMEPEKRLKTQLILALQHEHPNPIDMGKALKRYKKQTGHSYGKMSKTFGISKRQLMRYVHLLKLPEHVQEGISEGRIRPNSTTVRKFLKKKRAQDGDFNRMKTERKVHSIKIRLAKLQRDIMETEFDPEDMDEVSKRVGRLWKTTKLLGKNNHSTT